MWVKWHIHVRSVSGAKHNTVQRLSHQWTCLKIILFHHLHRRKPHGGLRMDIVCYERIATLIQMKEMNESRLRSCPGSATSSDRQWELVLDALSPLEHGAFHKYTHTRRNTAAWFIKGQMWLFSPLPLKVRFLCGCQRKLRKDTENTLITHTAVHKSGLGKICNLRICFHFMNVNFNWIGHTP